MENKLVPSDTGKPGYFRTHAEREYLGRCPGMEANRVNDKEARRGCQRAGASLLVVSLVHAHGTFARRCFPRRNSPTRFQTGDLPTHRIRV